MDVDSRNMTEGVHQLVNMLQMNVIDGITLDRYELLLFYQYFSHSDDVKFLKQHTMLTEVKLEQRFIYGILVKTERDYNFLSGFVRSNRHIITACNELFLNMYTRNIRPEKQQHSLFSIDGQLFWPMVYSSITIIALIFACGSLHEIRIRLRARRRRKISGEHLRFTSALAAVAVDSALSPLIHKNVILFVHHCDSV